MNALTFLSSAISHFDSFFFLLSLQKEEMRLLCFSANIFNGSPALEKCFLFGFILIRNVVMRASMLMS